MQLKQPQHFLLLQVISPHYHRSEALRNMYELTQLVHTYGGVVMEKAIQHRPDPHPSTYIGPGKLTWLKQKVAELNIDIVVVNAVAKSSQLFRLERALWEVKPSILVWDRVDLILNIFDKHATSTQAKLQIELARISHRGPRIYGLGGSELSRQGGGIGTRGIGETNIERERRLIKKRVQSIKKQLEQLAEKKRERISFRSEQGIGPVALVGYTSAGKTTLFNALVGKSKQTHSGLFTTLDTVVGKMKSPHHALPVLVSDTIGFIEQLPPSLVEAFQSTLLESMEAKLLLHVVDALDENILKKIKVVSQILDSLSAHQPHFLVLNKSDLVSNKKRKIIEQELRELPLFWVSALTGEGIPLLKEAIIKALS